RPPISPPPPKAPLMPGTPRSVTASYTWWAGDPAQNLQLKLDVPAGWTAEQTSPPVPGTLRSGQRATATWDVTAPAHGTFGDAELAATGTTSHGTPITDTAPAALSRPTLLRVSPHELSSTQGAASRADDGNIDGIWGHGSVAHSLQEPQPWWQVDLGASQDLGDVVLWNRVDCCAER